MRVSGARALDVRQLFAGDIPRPRHAALRSIQRPDGTLIDRGLVLCFPGPSSFTGEDCIEFHLHGGRAVITALLDELARLEGFRLAEAGEFSRRAFENGKLDLVELEGLADLIAAETEMQRRLAVEQGFGGQSALYRGWADRLTRARALVEAELDFADEDDVPGSVSERVWNDMAVLHAEIVRHIDAGRAGEIIRDGYKVAIVGRPNAGKSSLLNAIAGRDVAIVTDVAGTTRDVLSVDLNLGGYLVRFFDTAGLRDSDDAVEQEGIRRAHVTMEGADLVLRLCDLGSPPDTIPQRTAGNDIQVGTKVDRYGPSDAYDICISSQTGEGLAELKELILRRIEAMWTGALAPSRERQIRYLKEASILLEDAINGDALDIRAECLRSAAASLGRITGAVDVDQLLDVIFSQFCIGK